MSDFGTFNPNWEVSIKSLSLVLWDLYRQGGRKFMCPWGWRIPGKLILDNFGGPNDIFTGIFIGNRNKAAIQEITQISRTTELEPPIEAKEVTP